MATAAPATRTFRDPGRCRACGAEIDWVELLYTRGPRQVDTTPCRHAEYLVFRGGKRALDVRRPDVLEDLSAQAYDGTRFCDHLRTCPVASLRTVAPALGVYTDHLEGVVIHGDDPEQHATQRLRTRTPANRTSAAP
jgi:hypothetical protein